MIMWFLSFTLLIWYIILMNFCILSQPCIPGVSPTWSHLALKPSLPLILLPPHWTSLLWSLCWFLLIFPTSKDWNDPGLSPGPSSFLCLHSISRWCQSVSLLCIICICCWLPVLFSSVCPSLLNSMLKSTYLLNSLLGCLTNDFPPTPVSLPLVPVSVNDNFTLSFAQDRKKWSHPRLPFLTTLNVYTALFQNTPESSYFSPLLNYHPGQSKPPSSLTWIIAVASSVSCRHPSFPSQSQLFYVASKVK